MKHRDEDTLKLMTQDRNYLLSEYMRLKQALKQIVAEESECICPCGLEIAQEALKIDRSPK